MNERELRRASVIELVTQRKLTQREAAERLGLQERQVRNLQRRYEREGPQGMISRRRGMRPGNATPEHVRRKALERLRDPDYRGFSAQHARNQLAQEEGIDVSRETVRKWQVEAGVRKPGKVQPTWPRPD